MNPEDWASWKSHPVTKYYMRLLEQTETHIASDFGYDPESVEKTALFAAYQTGLRHGLREAIEMEPEAEEDD
jgi:hypothetical protein